MPDEYISRAKALADFKACNAENPNWTPQRVKTLLLRQPAADVVPVVRCKDCKHRTEKWQLWASASRWNFDVRISIRFLQLRGA